MLCDATFLGLSTNVFRASSVDALIFEVIPACVRLCEQRGSSWGVDLHLDRDVLEEIENPSRFEALGLAVRSAGLRVPSLNLYPLCRFQEGVVKEKVYLPDWSDPLRMELTLRGARWLQQYGHGRELTLSTLAGSFHPAARPVEEEFSRLAATYARVARELSGLSDAGRNLVLCPEPEPGTTLQNLGDIQRLWRQLPNDAATRAHLGICLDACHFFVMGEDPLEVFTKLQGEHISVPKIQASAALVADLPASQEAQAALQTLCEPRFLHQTTLSGTQGRRLHLDLPGALGDSRPGDRELTCHFHMPLFLENLDVKGLRTSGPATSRLVRAAAAHPHAPGIFAETYTWSVLGQRFAPTPEEGIARELEWLASRSSR